MAAACAKAEFGRDDALIAVFPSSDVSYREPGIMVGMDQKDSSSGDEAHSKRREMSVEYPIEHGIVTKRDNMERTADDTVESEEDCS